jgi:phage tail sheath protein FI
MTQDDIDNGRWMCLIGVAPIRPAKFVMFRIGQSGEEATRRRRWSAEGVLTLREYSPTSKR